MAAFPAIRAPLKSGWRGASPDGVRATRMDAGPSKKRIESTAEPAVETFVFKLLIAQAETLDAFYATNKALRFDLTHWIWGAVDAEFFGPPQWGQDGRWFLATVQMEIYR